MFKTAGQVPDGLFVYILINILFNLEVKSAASFQFHEGAGYCIKSYNLSMVIMLCSRV